MYFLCRYCIRLCSQTCHLVGSSQARHWWVAGAAHTGPVWKCQMQSACWLQPEWRVQCESGHSPRLLLEPLTVHHGSGSPFPGVSYRMSLGKPVCRWLGHHHWITGEITTETDPLVDHHGRKGTSGQHGQNQGPDTWAGAQCASEVWQDPCGMCLKGIGTILFSVVVVPVGSTRNAVASLVVWSLMPASGVNGTLDRPDE